MRHQCVRTHLWEWTHPPTEWATTSLPRMPAASLACLLLATPLAPAQAPTDPTQASPGAPNAVQPGAAQPDPDSTRRTQLAGSVELARLVDLASQLHDVAIDYDPSLLSGVVAVRSEAGLSDSELWQLLQRSLFARGLALVRTTAASASHSTHSYSISRLADATNLAPATADARSLAGAGFASVLVPARHRSTAELAEAISKLLSKPGGSAQPIGGAAGVGAGVGVGLGAGVVGYVLVSDTEERLARVLELVELLDVADQPAEVVELPTRHLDAQRLALLLTQVVAKQQAVSRWRTPGDVLASPDGRSLLLIAPPAYVAEWRSLVQRLDQREPVQTLTYTPSGFPAGDVASLIQRVLAPAGGAEASPPAPRVVVDELTASLIVTATSGQHEQVRAILERLDRVPPAARRPMRTFVIKNRPVSEIKSVVEQLMLIGAIESAQDLGSASQPAPSVPPSQSQTQAPIQPTPQATNAAVSSATPPGPWTTTAPPGATPSAIPPSAPAQPTSQPATPLASFVGPARGSHTGGSPPPLVLASDEATNTLIAVGEPRALDQVETLIASLDVRQSQVMLEFLLVSLTEAQTRDLGVELEKLWPGQDVVARLSSLFGLGSRDSAGNRVAPDAAGGTGVVLSPGDFSIVLRALETINRGRSMSMPRILVANNETARLDSVTEQPFASVNAGSTVSTTSFGGVLPAGTQISVTPQIAAGDHLSLQYSVELSSFVGSPPLPELPPPRQQSSVQSVATIPDGHTVVMGGIELASSSRSRSQVPVLGDLPVVGGAFSSTTRNSSRSRFFVFVRAGVMRSGGFEDLKHISNLATDDARIDDGWPRTQPRVIR